ncbi:MAG: GyrI-like domain-containing protein [Anaerolineae bacterium]|nr:GyrI-like domain-containing protein [Anaerolineae bacterium]
MVPHRIVERPAFVVAGRTVWISGQDNEQFGRFWAQCRTDGTFSKFEVLTKMAPGPQTGGHVLGVSRVEADPTNRAFSFMVTVEVPKGINTGDLETYTVPACRWAIFEALGPVPQALVAAEIYAFMEWLPVSGHVHGPAPELEVYPPSPDDQPYCEFWLPVGKEGEE